MAISSFPAQAAGGGGRTDLVFAPGAHTVDFPEGYYILEVLEDVKANGTSLSNGFQKLDAFTSLEVGLVGVAGYWELTDNPPTASDDFEDVIFENDLFVAVGIGGVIYTSQDGLNWAERTSPINGNFRTITYGDGLFVAAGDDGELITSPDAITWTVRNSNIVNDIQGITYGDGLFVAVGRVASLTTSPDGINWTDRTSTFTFNEGNWSDIAYGNGLFVFTGSSGIIYSSPDGINWTERNSNFGNENIETITYADGLFVAAGGDTNNANITTSPDGINWTSRGSAGLSFSIQVSAYGFGVFIIADIGSNVATSPDGITWTIKNTGLGNVGFNGFASNSEFFVGVCRDLVIAIARDVNPNAVLLLTELPEAIQP